MTEKYLYRFHIGLEILEIQSEKFSKECINESLLTLDNHI